MFDHVELVIPPTNQVEATVDKVMRSEMRGRKAWCDFYFIGGAWNGIKRLDNLDLQPFFRRLEAMNVTVSIVKWGGSRDYLQPENQAGAVDAVWRSFYPGRGESCPLFAQYEGPRDINWCPVADVSGDLSADRVLVANPSTRRRIIHLDRDALRPFNHKVRAAIRSIQNVTPKAPADDWLVVTLCCHW